MTQYKRTLHLIRGLTAISFSLTLLLLFQFTNMRFFSFGIMEAGKSLLLYHPREAMDTTMMLFNTGPLSAGELEPKIEALLDLEPKVIGLNLCHLDERERERFGRFESNPKFVICNCDENGTGASSIAVNSAEEISHFKADRPDYFEIRLSDSWSVLEARGNSTEMINYRPTMEDFFHVELKDSVAELVNPDVVRNKTFLVGYLGNNVDESIRAITDSFEIYDLHVSANIISMLRSGKFIDEIGVIPRIALMLIFCLINIAMIRIIQTRWLSVNLLIYVFVLTMLSPLAFMLTAILFVRGVYLELTELPVLLFVSSVLGIIFFYKQEHKPLVRLIHKYSSPS